MSVCLSVEIKKILTSFTASFGGRGGVRWAFFIGPGRGEKAYRGKGVFPLPLPVHACYSKCPNKRPVQETFRGKSKFNLDSFDG